MIIASYLLHPLNGLGYQFFSGIGSSISEWATLTVALGVYLYHHNCHQHRCLRTSWHPGRDGHPYCKRHHLEHPSEGVIRNLLKRLGLRGPTEGPVRFHYTKKRAVEAETARRGEL